MLCTLAIIYLSGNPGISVPPEMQDLIGIDKLAHLLVYAIHTYALRWAWKPQSKWHPIWALVLSGILGIAMEVMQYLFFPNRYFEVLDIMANIIGSFTGYFLFVKFHH